MGGPAGAGSTSGEAQPLLQGLRSRASKPSSLPQIPALPLAHTSRKSQITSLSLTFLIWKMGPRAMTTVRWAVALIPAFSWANTHLVRGSSLSGGRGTGVLLTHDKLLWSTYSVPGAALNPSEFRQMLARSGMQESGLSPWRS